MMAKSGLAAAGAAGAGPKPPSSLGRLARFGVSLYILAAIVYTAYHLVVVPAVSYVAGPSSSSLARQEQQQQPAPRAILLEANVAASARDSTSAVEGATSTTTSSKNRHAALETAGVRAADIRSEDSRDPVWAAAESADKKGAKKAKPGVYRPPEKLLDGRELVRTRVHGFDGVDWDQDQVVWHHPSADLAHSGPNSPERTLKLYGNNPRGVKTTSEDELLSLSFGSSLQPSKVIPYYYRATEPDRPDFDTEDITITTLVTSNRFTVFERLVERYQGASFFFWLPKRPLTCCSRLQAPSRQRCISRAAKRKTRCSVRSTSCTPARPSCASMSTCTSCMTRSTGSSTCGGTWPSSLLGQRCVAGTGLCGHGSRT